MPVDRGSQVDMLRSRHIKGLWSHMNGKYFRMNPFLPTPSDFPTVLRHQQTSIAVPGT